MAYQDIVYPKIPFYLTYPMQNMYMTEMEYEKDLDRMKEYYPAETKKIMKLVEDRLDQLEYEGSRIYDEEPDHLMIQMEIDGIYRQLMEDTAHALEKPVHAASYFDTVPPEITGGELKVQERGCDDNWLCSMVGVLFGTELCRRRCRYRRCRRWL